MQSLQSIDMIQGRPALSPEGMRALVLGRGHTLLVEADDESATVKCHRKEWAPEVWSSHTFSVADAERAKLLGKDNWNKYPRAMLTARATAEACRATFPDVIAGVSYTPEESSTSRRRARRRRRPNRPDTRRHGGHASRTRARISVPPCVEGAEELEERLNALAPANCTSCLPREGCAQKNLFFPPETPGILERMAVEVSAIEDRAADAGPLMARAAPMTDGGR